jgi:hypothetical protein
VRLVVTGAMVTIPIFFQNVVHAKKRPEGRWGDRDLEISTHPLPRRLDDALRLVPSTRRFLSARRRCDGLTVPGPGWAHRVRRRRYRVPRTV